VANEVVAHFIDGRLVKGVCLDVDPGRPTCHITTVERETTEVKLAELKALFFVRDLTGDPARYEESVIHPDDVRTRGASRIELEFADGERLVGLTVRFPPVRPFFYVLPADPRSNNLRILVNRAAVVRMGRPSNPAG
jgi:hypothetical protein